MDDFDLPYDQEFSAEVFGAFVEDAADSTEKESAAEALSNEFDAAMQDTPDNSQIVGDQAPTADVFGALVEAAAMQAPQQEPAASDEFDAAMQEAPSVPVHSDQAPTTDLFGALVQAASTMQAPEQDPAGALSDEFDAAMLEPPSVPEILADQVMHAAEQRLIEEHQPVLVRHKGKKSEPKFRQWQLDSGQVFGPAGAETTITLKPQTRFRCEKIMATDDSSNPGAGTRILSIVVGNKPQKVDALGSGSLTQFFSQNALANGISFDTASPWAEIQIRVKFTQQCNFEISLFGTGEETADE